MMVVANNVLKKIQNQRLKPRREEKSMPKSISIKQIENELGFDRIRPIVLAPSDEQDAIEKEDCFEDWYEEELRVVYDRIKRLKK